MIRIFTSKKQKVGEEGEKEAISYLNKGGFSIIARNVSNKFGEIDIVAKKKGEYWFFEVKTGRYGSFINPAENLTREKIRKFLVSVEYYCMVEKITRYRVQGILVREHQPNKYTVECIDMF